MRRRLCFSILAAAVCLAALGGVAERASAAIRVTISDSVNTKVFYSPNSRFALINTEIGAYDILLQTTLSNYPGQEAGGVLSQTINLSDDSDPGLGILPTLTVTADIINDLGIAAGEVTGANLSVVNGASLAFWTLPSGSPLLVSSDVSSAEPSNQALLGTVQNHTTVNGTVVSSLEIGINATIEAEQFGLVDNGVDGYTLSSQVVLSGPSEGISGLAIGASSSVLAGPIGADVIPEPGTLVVWGLGALGLVVAARRRRLRLQSN